MAGRFGFGLRMQIVVALSVAFVLSFALLSTVALELSGRARSQSRQVDAAATAAALAAALGEAPDEARFARLAEAVLGRAGIGGVELRTGSQSQFSRGAVGLGAAVEAEAGPGTTLRLWVQSPASPREQSLGDLFLLYVVVTGAGILLFAYGMLTHLIVRPLDALTHASSKMAAGQLGVRVPSRGAAEIARLARSFNAMGAQLREDQAALEVRLADLTRTTRELEAAQDQVVRSAQLASVGRLSAGVAHEIGNPLAAILGLVELVRGGGLSVEEEREFLRRIQAETERIHAIIRDLLDFARNGAEPGSEDDEATADLGAVVEAAVQLVGPQRGLRGIDIERRMQQTLPRVRGREDRLIQVVLNLLLNAADAIEGGGQIRVEVELAEPGWVRLAVVDSGPGIPEAIREHLFEPFVTTKAVGKGTGLGLAVCHTIIERLGGTIRAESSREGGARFAVTLPAARESDTRSA